MSDTFKQKAVKAQLDHTMVSASMLFDNLTLLRKLAGDDNVTLKKLQADAERAIDELQFYIDNMAGQ